MTDRRAAPTIFATLSRRLQWAGWALLGAGCLMLAMNSAAQTRPPLELPKFVPDPDDSDKECKVETSPFTDTITKASSGTGLVKFLVGTKVTGMIVKCGNSPTPKTVLYVQLPDGKSGTIPATGGNQIAFAFATDPFTVGAFASDGSSLKPYHAYRYDLDTNEFKDLGTLGGPAGSSSAMGVNIDGTVVVGASFLTTAGASVSQAFRWTPALGMQNLGAILPDSYSAARATSHDGTIVVGGTYVPGPNPGDYAEYRAFRWTLTNPATGAGKFTDLGATTYEALAVSADGSVVVGNGKGNQAFLWTQAGRVVNLGVLAGHTRSMATAVSADGKVVVGISSAKTMASGFANPVPTYDQITSRAFRWTQATGMVDLNTLAATAGYDLTGITLVSALGVSADGQTIVGAGRRDGETETFAFTVSNVAATGGGGTAAPVSVVEFYNAALDHYFITYVPDEIAKLDNGTFKGWTRTGLSFKAFAAAPVGASAVCRIYIPPGKGDGHFFGRDTNECDGTMVKNPTFVLESSAFLHLYPPTLGTCAAGQVPVYRVYSNRADANHRYTTSRTVRDQMVGKGWLAEGDGADVVVMCAPA